MSLDFVLELDADDRIVGGEWVGGSKSRHPDFIWVPLGADSTGYNTEGTYMTFGDDQIDGREGSGGKVTYTDAPDMRYSDVRRVLAVSRTEEGETFTAYDGEAADLPANKTTVLEVAVPDEGAVVRDALVYLDATAEQTVGLKVELESPSGTVVHLFDVPSDTREWQPGRFPQGHDLGVLKGVAHSMPLVSEAGELYPGLRRLVDEAATGTWTLRVENAGAGAARLDGWSLWLTSAAE